METRVRIRVGTVEIEVVGEEEFVTNRLPTLLSDLMGRLTVNCSPVESRPSAGSGPANGTNAGLASIAGDVRDYWSDVPVAGAQVTTIGLEPNLMGRSDEVGRFIMSGRSTGDTCYLVANAPDRYAETMFPIELSRAPMTLSVLAIANADINRQYASVGVIRTPDTAMIIVELLDSGRGPLEMVPLSDITLTAPSGLVVGDGPYFFGANGDIQQRPDMPLSRAFAKVAPPRGSASEKRARAAFINVPNGEHTLQVTAAGAAGTWARATVAVRAAGGATVVEARLPT